MLAGAVTVFFALTGAEITTMAAAESAEPARAVGADVDLGHRAHPDFLRAVDSAHRLRRAVGQLSRSGESPFTLCADHHGLRLGEHGDGVIILTAVLSCLNSAFYVCSRVLFMLAEHGDAPQGLVKLNARRVPARSVWMSSLAGVSGVLADTQLRRDGVCLPGRMPRARSWCSFT